MILLYLCTHLFKMSGLGAAPVAAVILVLHQRLTYTGPEAESPPLARGRGLHSRPISSLPSDVRRKLDR